MNEGQMITELKQLAEKAQAAGKSTMEDIVRALYLASNLPLDIFTEPADIATQHLEPGATAVLNSPLKIQKLQRADGLVLYAAFTKDEIMTCLNKIGNSSIMKMPGADFFKLIAGWGPFVKGEISGVAINPFTAPLVIPRTIILDFVQRMGA